MEDTTGTVESIETTGDLGKGDRALAQRWKLELRLADKREKKWRERAKAALRVYTPEDSPAANTFNILWTNTETLRQATYNSLPQPIAKRRYDSDDPIGKECSTILTRSLEFAQSAYDFDGLLKGDILAMLLPGRGVSRVRYIPSIRQVAGPDTTASDSPEEFELKEDKAHEVNESESFEEIDWEQVICERVQWGDFRHGPGSTWDEVTWCAFRLNLKKEDIEERFGAEIAGELNYSDVDDEDVNKSDDRQQEAFKVAEVWEVWDKESKTVVFISKTYDCPLLVEPDPLNLSGFFPNPRPLLAIERQDSLVPVTLYSQYQEQAKELNRISFRINKIVDALKVRGIYDKTISEIGQLTAAAENTLIPATNLAGLLAHGGIEKAIWMMPIGDAAQVLVILHQQREATKQVIYEITGISDILRAATNASETLGAQKIKTAWGSQRLQRLQLEVQRYIRDLLRLKAEVIAEKFQIETLAAMTLLKLPREAELEQQYQQQLAQYQQQVQMIQQQPPPQAQPGQPPSTPPQLPPPPQRPTGIVTWEVVQKTLQSDMLRSFAINIETDSTLSATQDSNMEDLAKVLGGVAQAVTAFGPLVEKGAMPIEVIKEIILTITRRAKLGSAVEDSLAKLKQPPPQPDPNAGKLEAEQAKLASQEKIAMGQVMAARELETLKVQQAIQIKQMETQMADTQHQRQVQADMELERWKQQMQQEQVVQQNQVQAEREVMKTQQELEVKLREAEMTQATREQEMLFERWKVEYEGALQLQIAELSANTTITTSEIASRNTDKTETD